MDADLAGIFVFILIAGILALGSAQIFHRRTVRHEERKLELTARIEEARARQGRAAREADELIEERLRVLERIVTDPSSDLSRQIESLRDLRDEGEKVL